MPLYVMYKGNSNDIPAISEKSMTQVGRFSKKSNCTIYRYDKDDNLYSD